MAKQYDLFGFEIVEDDPQGYTKKVQTVTYTPSDKKPRLLELLDSRKADNLIARIENADIPDDEKKFLKAAATRHNKFTYAKIADYYAHSNPTVQRLMEDSALVIIDIDRAIEQGYIRLSDKIKKQYLSEYNDQ